MINLKSNLNPQALAERILNGDALPSDAMSNPAVYPYLNTGKNGNALPFLGTSVKIDAGLSVGVLTNVLYLVPARASGREACAGRSAGCTDVCLVEHTGKMSFPNAQRARRRRHASFYADRKRFMSDLAAEIARHERRAIRAGKVPAIRLNGTSDLPWERLKVEYAGKVYPNLMSAFPSVTFYDYTKIPLRVRAKGAIPPNYHLTFSLSERPDADARAAEYLTAGHNAAVVFNRKKGNLPSAYTLPGYGECKVIDGDKHDARFLDGSGVIVGLSAKGDALRDTSGFVRDAGKVTLCARA